MPTMIRSTCALFLMAMFVMISVGAGPAATEAEAPQKRDKIVPCDAHMRSDKRGVCANKLVDNDFRVLSTGVSWWYNWHFTSHDTPPDDVSFDYVPMVWGDDPDSLAGLEAHLKSHPKPRRIMILNEPNLKDQAFIPPKRTAEVYKQAKAIADKFGVPVDGPHMSLGSATEASITAYDPIDKKEVTYTYMVPFLKAFLYYVGDTEVPGIGYHAYGDMNEVRWSVDEMYKQFGKPLWVTEYARWDARDMDTAITHIMQATDLFERTEHVHGYAFFKERADNPYISLLEKEPGKLSPLGEVYVNMPVHDKHVYYQIPGKLQAERYVTMNNAEIYPTKDADGFADMTTTQARGELSYNIYTESAGMYELTLRISGESGEIQLGVNKRIAAAVTPTQNGWQDVKARLRLKAGKQTLLVRFASEGQTLNWIEFVEVE